MVEEHLGDGGAPSVEHSGDEGALGGGRALGKEEQPGVRGAPWRWDGGAPGSTCQLSDKGSSVNALSSALVFGQLTDELC